MNTEAKQHLAKAKEYADRGEQFYRMAAEQMIAARQAEPLTWKQIAEVIGRSASWCSRVVSWHEEYPDSDSLVPVPKTFYTQEKGESDKRQRAQSVLRDAPAEQIADMLSDPNLRAKVSRATEIAHEQIMSKSRQEQRQAIGEENADQLDQQQQLHEAEAALFKARRAVIDVLRALNDAHLEALPDSWREELLKTLDDIAAKVELGRSFVTGIRDDDLDQLLAGSEN